MDLGLFLPKVYHFVRQDYAINGKHFNQFISAYNTSNQRGELLLIIGCIVVCVGTALLLFGDYLHHAKKPSALTSSDIMGIIMLIGGFATAVVGIFFQPLRLENDTTKFGNGFQVKQTSFIIQPNEKPFQSNAVNYVLEGKRGSISTSSKDYAVYARVYNSSSHNYYNYLIGDMVNGNFETITTTQENHYWSKRTAPSGVRYIRDDDHDRLIKDEQLKALDTYIEFIKKHHLEDNFKNDAKLIISNKFYDKNYKPQLVMKGKDGRILYMKHNISRKDIANVGITK